MLRECSLLWKERETVFREHDELLFEVVETTKSEIIGRVCGGL